MHVADTALVSAHLLDLFVISGVTFGSCGRQVAIRRWSVASENVRTFRFDHTRTGPFGVKRKKEKGRNKCKADEGNLHLDRWGRCFDAIVPMEVEVSRCSALRRRR